MIRRPANDTRSTENRGHVPTKYGKPLLAIVLGIMSANGYVVRQYEKAGYGYYSPTGAPRKNQKYVIYKTDTRYRHDNEEESFRTDMEFKGSFIIEGISREDAGSPENTYLAASRLVEWMIAEDPSISDSVDSYMWYLFSLMHE